MEIYELDTPALVVDLAVLEHNIGSMASHCAEIGIALRAHTKTTKVPEIARIQLAAGSQGIVCQKVGEAEVMARAGMDDILITYNVVGQSKVRRLVELTRWADIMVTLDSEEVAQGMSREARGSARPIGVLVELDTGGNRTGVQSPRSALNLGTQVSALPGLDLRGIMTYPSHPRAKPFIDETRRLFDEAGLPCPIISGGGTGREVASRDIGCTETRSGSYVFDGMTRIGGDQDLHPERCPLRVMVTVVSVPTKDRVIIDGGMKTFRSFPPSPYGLIVEYPEARIEAMSVEHGHVNVSECHHQFHVGERLSVIPNHGESVVNLHDEMAAAREGHVEEVWQIRGRGKIR